MLTSGAVLFAVFSARFSPSEGHGLGRWCVAANGVQGEAGTLTGANNSAVRAVGVAGALALTSTLGLRLC